MPDITMCADHACALNQYCYRYTATPSEFRQAYFAGSPKKRVDMGDVVELCEYYWANAPEHKGKHRVSKE